MIDQLSLSSLQLQVYFDETPLGNATGFVIKSKEQLYLVTNWHVVTGIDPRTGKLNEQAAIPNNIKVKYNRIEIKYNGGNEIKLSLFDDNGQKKWLEYPKYITKYPNGKEGKSINVPLVDVILLPMQNEIFPLDFIFDLETLLKKDMYITPALPISVIGYPFNDESRSSSLPIWITGFIASEPDVDMNQLPLIYINASGYSGLSGSPVIARTYGFLPSDPYKKSILMTSSHHTKFIGIYSGRITTHRVINDPMQDSLSLCYVWKAKVIYTILEQKI